VAELWLARSAASAASRQSRALQYQARSIMQDHGVSILSVGADVPIEGRSVPDGRPVSGISATLGGAWFPAESGVCGA
jgi:hypothetical protein